MPTASRFDIYDQWVPDESCFNYYHVQAGNPPADLMLCMMALYTQFGKLQISSYFKNHWTNTRLVCTHLNSVLNNAKSKYSNENLNFKML